VKYIYTALLPIAWSLVAIGIAFTVVGAFFFSDLKTEALDD
jgi:hypothetical protein